MSLCSCLSPVSSLHRGHGCPAVRTKSWAAPDDPAGGYLSLGRLSARGAVSSMRQDAESAMTGCEDALKTTAVFRVPGLAGAPCRDEPSKCLWLKNEGDSSEP